MPVSNNYHYTRLPKKDAIRLVKLHPSRDETAQLTCQIVETSLLERDLHYSAISYVWGTRQLSEPLKIRCDEDFKYLDITRSAETVLKAFRTDKQPRYLWIDAICFNQADDSEKAQQIPIMGEIYKKADTVEIWLGPENHMTSRTFMFLGRLSRMPDETHGKRRSQMAQQIVTLMKKLIHHDESQAMQTVLRFFKQPWFSRLWIIQEACLGRRGVVHCGKSFMSLQSLSQAANRLQCLDFSEYQIKVAAILGRKATKLTMLELLWHSHDSACLERKDRIAAFVGLARDGQDFPLDYTDSWDVIFREFAYFSYQKGSNKTRLQLLLHLFEFGSMSERNPDVHCSSWIPDWSKPRSRKLPYISGPKESDTSERYPSSPGQSAQAIISFNGCLQIQANVVGSGIRGLRVSATYHQSDKDDSQSGRASDVIQKLFPLIPQAMVDIWALAALLRTVSEFRHSAQDREEASQPLPGFESAFKEHIAKGFEKALSREELFKWLRTLDAVLHEFCLAELRCDDSEAATIRAYGIGGQSIRASDIVIPLWQLQSDHQHFLGAFQLSTMLVVRRDIDAYPESESFQYFRIVGPMTCVVWNEAARKRDRPSELEQCQEAEHPHPRPIRII